MNCAFLSGEFYDIRLYINKVVIRKTTRRIKLWRFYTSDPGF